MQKKRFFTANKDEIQTEVPKRCPQLHKWILQYLLWVRTQCWVVNRFGQLELLVPVPVSKKQTRTGSNCGSSSGTRIQPRTGTRTQPRTRTRTNLNRNWNSWGFKGKISAFTYLWCIYRNQTKVRCRWSLDFLLKHPHLHPLLIDIFLHLLYLNLHTWMWQNYSLAILWQMHMQKKHLSMINKLWRKQPELTCSWVSSEEFMACSINRFKELVQKATSPASILLCSFSKSIWSSIVVPTCIIVQFEIQMWKIHLQQGSYTFTARNSQLQYIAV